MITCPNCRHQFENLGKQTAVCEKCQHMLIICSDCAHEIDQEPDTVGEVVVCENCGAELLITNLKPFKFELLDAEK